jgi:hypothetical protein
MPTIVPFLVRWAARLSAFFIASAYMFFLLGEFYAPHSGPPASLREWAGIVLITLAVAGMVAAWWRELPGAVLSLAALLLFALLIPMRQYGVVAIVAIPGILYLLDWTVRHPVRMHSA